MTLDSPVVQSAARAISFIRRGEVVTLGNVPPERTVLELLREDLGATGTKEGCGEGDCGACTVVLGEAEHGSLRFRAVNSCIRLAHSIDGLALWTVEDIAPTLVASRTALPPEGALRLRPGEAGSAALAGDAAAVQPMLVASHTALPSEAALRLRRGPSTASGQAQAGSTAQAGDAAAVQPTLHPAQEAMVQCHASQCGFCTPGFVMSLFAMYQDRVTQGKRITRALAQEALSGNLCRCTGYRPILDAAQAMADLPPARLDESDLLSKLKQLSHRERTDKADSAYELPRTLAELLRLRAAHPAAQLVAGCTDVGLWVTKQHRQFAQVIDLTRVAELRHIADQPDQLVIGAAVTLADAFAALVQDRPQLHAFAARFAGLPVRNSGTLGGNVANGSPIGDSMPLLIALGAQVVLASLRGRRELALEALYTGYRTNVMAADEVLAFVKVPKAGRGNLELLHPLVPSPRQAERWGEGLPEFLRVYKISKRYDDDISAVCLALRLQIDQGVVARASIGAGGVAATPARAVNTEAALAGRPWTLATVQAAMAVLRAEFTPISDMRASSAYRSEVLGNLLQRYWLESQGVQQIDLSSFVLAEGA